MRKFLSVLLPLCAHGFDFLGDHSYIFPTKASNLSTPLTTSSSGSQ